VSAIDWLTRVPAEALTALETSLKLFDANPCVNTFAIFYEQGGEDGARLVGLEVGHEALGGCVGAGAERAHDGAERSVARSSASASSARRGVRASGE